MSQTKTKTLIRQNAALNDNFEQVDSFVYLDTTFTKNNNEIHEINRRFMLANKLDYANSVLRQQDVDDRPDRRAKKHVFGC